MCSGLQYKVVSFCCVVVFTVCQGPKSLKNTIVEDTQKVQIDTFAFE